MDERVVTGADGLDQQAAQAGVGKYGLGHHGSANEGGHHQADDGDKGQQGIAHDMTANHIALGQPLGAGGAHIVSLELAEQGGTKKTSEDTRHVHPQR